MNNICVGLFGTCDGSRWRKPFMEAYTESNIEYFNPDAGADWHPGLIEDENRHLNEDQIILFPVLNESLGFGSLGEIGFSILNVKRNIEKGNNQYLIVLIDEACHCVHSTDEEDRHSNRARKLVKSKLLEVNHPNVIIVDNLEDMLAASWEVIDIVKLQQGVRKFMKWSEKNG